MSGPRTGAIFAISTSETLQSDICPILQHLLENLTNHACKRNSINDSFTHSGSSCCSQWVASGKYVSLPSAQYCKLSCASSARRATSFLPQRMRVGTCTCGLPNFGAYQKNARYQLIIAVMAPECDHASA